MKKLLTVAILGLAAVAGAGLMLARMAHKVVNGQHTNSQPNRVAQPSAVQAISNPADGWEVKTSADIAGVKHITLERYGVILRCSPKLEMYVIPDASNIIDYEEDHRQTVRYKLRGEKTVHVSSWAVSDDATALFLPMSVILPAIKADEITVEYREYERTADAETFDLEGLNEAFHNAGFPTKLAPSRTSHAADSSPSSSYTLPDGRKVEPGLLDQ